jgi:hypothetical protein
VGRDALSVETALGIIKGHLGLEPMVTDRGDQVKCYVPDLDEGGAHKTYFDAKDLYELAECFTALGDAVFKEGTDA